MNVNEKLVRLHNDVCLYNYEGARKQSIKGYWVQDAYFNKSYIPEVIFGKIYYIEYEGMLCQCRLNKIVHCSFSKDIFSTIFDVAYKGKIVPYIYGRYVDEKGEYKYRNFPIYDSVENFKLKKTISKVGIYGGTLTSVAHIFNVFSDNYFNTYSAYECGGHKHNYMECYQWNGVKVVPYIPQTLKSMLDEFSIESDGIYIGKDRVPFSAMLAKELDSKENSPIYNNVEDCLNDNEIQISTFDDIEKTEKKDDDIVEIKLSFICNKKYKELFEKLF